MAKINHYADTGELSACTLCHQLHEHVRPVKVTYNICTDCKLNEYEVVKKGTAQWNGTIANVTASTPPAPPVEGKVASDAIPPRRLAEIKSMFKPEGFIPQ